MSSFHFYRWNQFKVVPVISTLRRRNQHLNFLGRPTRVDGTTLNADISQWQAASDDRLLSQVTLGRVERSK